MPEWASRLTLEVTGVRVERLREATKDPTERDLKIEGFNSGQSSVRHFIEYWDSLFAPKGHPWGSNPWVWVLDYEVK